MKYLLLFLLTFPAFAQDACFRRVYNRGVPRRDVVAEIIKAVKKSPDSLVEVNPIYDIFSSVERELGPWKSLKHRKAALIDVLIVLSMFESSERWNAGIDTTNASSAKNKCNEEAGMFQCSGNSLNFGKPLRDLFSYYCKGYAGNTVCDKFITCSKMNHEFVIRYTAQLIRFTTKHHGPILRKEINPYLSRECTSQIEAIL